MDTKTEWLDNSTDNITSQFYTAEETIIDVQSNFDVRRYYSAEGYSIGVINSIPTLTATVATEQVLIQNYTNPLNEDREDRKIYFPIDSVAERGSYIDWNDKYWLVMTKVDSNEAYLSAKITQCTSTLKFLKDNILNEIPCVISKTQSTWGLDETKYIQLPDNEMYITIPNNSTTESITYNNKFNIGRSNYEVIAINDLTEGLLILTMRFTVEQAVTPTPTPVSTLTITGSSSIIKTKSATYTTTIPVTWTITNVDLTNNVYATITSQNSTSITLLASSIIGSKVKLKATKISDNLITSEKIIQVVNLF